MERLYEFVIVEGQADVSRVKTAVQAIVIEVGGYALYAEALAKIEALRPLLPGIILVDPDGPGRKIAQKLKNRFPELRQAEISAKQARSKNRRKVGVAYAAKEDILTALFYAGGSLLWQEEKWRTGDFIFAETRAAFAKKEQLPNLNAKDMALLCNRLAFKEARTDGY